MDNLQGLFHWDSSSHGSSSSDRDAGVRRRSWRERRAERQRKADPGVRRKGDPGIRQKRRGSTGVRRPKKKSEMPTSVSKTRTGKAKKKKKMGTKTRSKASSKLLVPVAATAVGSAVPNQLMHLFDWDEGLTDSSSSSDIAVLSDMWKSVLGKTVPPSKRKLAGKYFRVSYSSVSVNHIVVSCMYVGMCDCIHVCTNVFMHV